MFEDNTNWENLNDGINIHFQYYKLNDSLRIWLYAGVVIVTIRNRVF